MPLPLYQIDAFTDRPFAGNPAAVCLLDATRTDAWMQDVAREMNLSETAFLLRQGDGYQLRWFTPALEVELCGHATLASAHALWEAGQVPAQEGIRFSSKSGILTAMKQGEWIQLDFPATPARPIPMPDGLEDALGARPRWVGQSCFDYLVELDSDTAVRTLKPDFRKLAAISARGFIVTARSETPPFDFVSRFFAPQAGVDEDPVTGSAHCCLGPYWETKLGKTDLLAYQASSRGGVVRVRLQNDRVLLGGQAVTVFRGELL